MKNKNQKGITLMEVVIGASIVVLIFSGIVSVFNFYLRRSINTTDNVKAEILAEEGLEALRIIRDGGFSSLSNLSKNADYYLEFNGNTYLSTTTEELIDNTFYRKFRLYEVYRDGNLNIAPNGTLDADIVKASIFVSWYENDATTTRELSTYFANIFEI
ncbi:MAG: hypothetical protein AAB840_00065 [Patescibacteria group bacterium]